MLSTESRLAQNSGKIISLKYLYNMCLYRNIYNQYMQFSKKKLVQNIVKNNQLETGDNLS